MEDPLKKANISVRLPPIKDKNLWRRKCMNHFTCCICNEKIQDMNTSGLCPRCFSMEFSKLLTEKKRNAK